MKKMLSALLGWRPCMAKRLTICLMAVLSLSHAVSASVRDSTIYDYEYSGVFSWGEVLTSLCRDGWCRTQLPREFFELKVPLNVFEKTFDDAFKALSMQALADGYRLKKTGKKRPFTVIAEPDDKVEASYISWMDTSVRVVDARDLAKYKLVDSLKVKARQEWRDSVNEYLNSVHYPSAHKAVQSTPNVRRKVEETT